MGVSCTQEPFTETQTLLALDGRLANSEQSSFRISGTFSSSDSKTTTVEIRISSQGASLNNPSQYRTLNIPYTSVANKPYSIFLKVANDTQEKTSITFNNTIYTVEDGTELMSSSMFLSARPLTRPYFIIMYFG